MKLAAPQPTQKHFTDEELKQQYGIHLATRLQADGDGKEAKWADIDDDEDDWAPEAIEWNDGTKIDLTANNAAVLAAEQAAAEEAKQRQEEEEKAKSLLQKSTTTVGPNATVLKPRSTAQPKAGGLVLKTPSEKPSLVSKPAAPTPVRSPWASLPPVDKVPPIAINPDVPDSATRPQGYDAHSNNQSSQLAQPPTPAMEIAADSFSRNRGDAPNGHPGQLYNAQSGRYEPANTGRRGSVRKEQNFRPPSLLQRGSNDTRGPVGPSEAFQTRSSQPDQAPWSRRRSSNVSGDGSARRNSISKSMPNGIHEERRGSHQSQALQSPTVPRDGSPALPQSAVQSPAMRHAQMADPQPGNGSPNQSGVDIIAQQKQTMKEKREMAIKRKQEEEAREEAAKKERIRLKMEAMGMLPLEEKKDPAKKEIQKSIEKRPAEPTQAGHRVEEKPSTVQEPIQVPAQSQEEAVAAKSLPKPPQPNASGAPQQYGMMKVHAATSNNMQQPDNERLQVERNKAQAQGQKTSPPGLQPRPTQGERIASPLINGIKNPEQVMEKAQDFPPQHQVREQPRQQPWNQVPNDQKALAGAGWSSQAATREPPNAHNNVWGAPNARSLGNGAFDRSIQRPQSRQQDHFASPTLAPIGPPKHLHSSRESREPSKINDVRTLEDFQTMPTFPPTEGRIPAAAPDPIGHHLSAEQQKPIQSQYANGLHSKPPTNHVDHAAPLQDHQKSSVAAWGNFHNDTAREEAIKRQQHAAKLADEVRRGVQKDTPQLPVMNETWRQVKVDQYSTQRSIIGIERGPAVQAPLPATQVNAELQTPAFGTPLNVGPPLAAGIGRGSRFFPSTSRGVHLPLSTPPGPFRPGHRRSSSPPPPDSEGHPAFVRDHPIVRVSLPLIGPKPKVKLPPSMASPVQSPRMADVQPVALRAAPQPLVNNPSWQDRFNGLLGVKKISPGRTFVRPAEPVVTSVSSASNKVTGEFSASKEAMTSPVLQSPSVAISLPQTGPANSMIRFKVDSKDVADEEELFIPESGSLPLAHLPPKEKTMPWGIPVGSRRATQKPTRLSKEVEALSKEDLSFANMIVNDIPLIFINLGGMSKAKSKPMAMGLNGLKSAPRGDIRPEHQQQQRPRDFSSGAKPPVKGFKARPIGIGNTGPNSPRTGPGAPHPKNAHHHTNPHMPNRTAPVVGGWDSSRSR